MNANIETAVRICPLQCLNGDMICVQSNPYHNTIHLGPSSVYPVTHALPNECTQSHLYTTVVAPLLSYLLEGCDISVVATGQMGMGKTYTLLGPGLSCASSVDDYGALPRFLRDLFALLSESYKDRTFTIHITWSQICGDNVQDLLGAGTGSVECKSIAEAFQLIQVGMTNVAPRCAHTLFTITLEQQWLLENKIQHRVSTASFADLAGCDKIIVMDSNGSPQSIPADLSLFALHKCVIALTDPAQIQIQNINVPYNQSVLTTLLRDSFGGRAKTVLISCVSPLSKDLSETFYTLQFMFRAQLVRNIVTVNSYTTNDAGLTENMDVFGLQFAANQLFKLVANAEELFQRLITTGSLNKMDMEQISHWLTLKQECEECISENSEPHRSLERIVEEEDDLAEEDSCSDSSVEYEEEEEEEEEPLENLMDRLEDNLKKFRIQTNCEVKKENSGSLVGSIQSSTGLDQGTKDSLHSSSNSEFHRQGARGRRNSIHLKDEIVLTSGTGSNPVTIDEETVQNDSNAKHKSVPDTTKTLESKQRMLSQICIEIQGRQKQIDELQSTIAAKEKHKQQIVRHVETRNSARDIIEQNMGILKQEHANTQQIMHQAKMHCDIAMQARCKIELKDIDRKLLDLQSIIQMTEDSVRKLMELDSSLHTSCKQLERLGKLLRKDEKRKMAYEHQVQRQKAKVGAATKTDKSADTEKSGCSKEEVLSSCGSQRDNGCQTIAIRKGSINDMRHGLASSTEGSQSNDKLESLRHEIRNLRRTRELLLEQRCQINKSTRSSSSSKSNSQTRNNNDINDTDQRKLLQYEEAIEAIDLAIEHKNQLICGREYFHTQVATNIKHMPIAMDQMLIDRLMNLDECEMRALVHKYFEKVIDLRCSSKKLELQVVDVENQNESLNGRVQNLTHMLQQLHLESERRIVSMQRKHEESLHLILAYIANGTMQVDLKTHGLGPLMPRAPMVPIGGPDRQPNNNNNPGAIITTGGPGYSGGGRGVSVIKCGGKIMIKQKK